MRYENLAAWQNCHRLVLSVYEASRTWPTDERYGLTSQVRRAAVSAAANIVEGVSRRGSREFRRFLDISRGSLAELTYLLCLAKELGYLTPGEAAKIEPLREQASKLTWGLYDSMKEGK